MANTSIKKNLIINTFYQFLSLITPLITAPYTARVLGAEGVGIYSFTQSFQMFFAMFAALGTATYGMREISIHRSKKEEYSKIFWEIELLSIITSIICIIIWLLFIICYGKYQLYLLILSLSLLNVLFDISWFYAGIEEFKYTILQNSFFKILGIILLFILIKKPSDLGLYILLMCLTTLLGSVSMWIYLPKFLCKINLKKLRFKKHFKETLVYFVPTIATSIYTILDKTLIGLITNDSYENGYYAQATKVINMCKALTFTSLNTVMSSRISYLFSQKKYNEVKNSITISIDYIFLVGFGMTFGLIAISKLFVPIFFGSEYDKVIVLLSLLSTVIVIIGISTCMGKQYYTPAGLRKKANIFVIIGSSVNLILNLLLIPYFKSVGAVISTIIAELLIAILYIYYSDKMITFKELFILSWKKIISGLIMFIIVYILSDIIVCHQIVKLLLLVLFGIVFYYIFLLLLKDNITIDITNKIFSYCKKLQKKRGKNL